MPKVTWFEIPAKDPKKTLEFYKKAFDWKIEPWGEKYWSVVGGEEDEKGIDGAIYLSEKMDQVMNTVNVPDIDDYMERVAQAGGKVMGEPHKMGEILWHVYFTDPEGNTLALAGPSKKR